MYTAIEKCKSQGCTKSFTALGKYIEKLMLYNLYLYFMKLLSTFAENFSKTYLKPTKTV